MYITAEKYGLEIKVSYITNQDKNQSLFFLMKVLLLVNARLGVGDLVQRGHFKAIGISPLTFVHVVSESQYHLEKLLEVSALQHLFRGFN